MRIAILTSTRERCGIAQYSRDLLAALAPLAEVDLVPIDPWPPEGERLEKLCGADVVHLQHEYSFWGTAFPPPSSYYEGLERFRKPGRFVITAHTVADAETVTAARGWGPRPVVKRASLAVHPALRDEIEVGPFATADRLIVHSQAAADMLGTRLNQPHTVHFWPMPVLEWTVPPSKWGPLSQQFGLHGCRLVTIFGFITAEKGYRLALRAIRRVRKRHPEVLLLIAGGARDPWGQALQVILQDAAARFEAARALRLPEMPPLLPGFSATHLKKAQARPTELPCRVTGYLTDPDARAILEQTEIALLPYRSGTGSYAAGAALAAGCALLTSDLPAFAEPLPALRFRNGGVEDLAEKLNSLLEDDEALAQLVQRSREYAARNSWTRAAERHLELYRELTSFSP